MNEQYNQAFQPAINLEEIDLNEARRRSSKKRSHHFSEDIAATQEKDSSDYDKGEQPENALSKSMKENLMDNSQRKWYKRVMKWTQSNKKAYVTIKIIQTIFTTIILEWTIVKFKAWKADRPNDPFMPAVKIALSMLCFDLLCYVLDFVMVLRRWKFCSQIRFIVCCLSFSLAVAIQTIVLIDQAKDERSFVEQFGAGGGPFRLLLLIIWYIY